MANPVLLALVAGLLAADGADRGGDQQTPPAEVTLTRAGDDACVDLPRPPEGVRGLREYARIPVEHDGQIVVRAAQLPFTSNQGYVYRQTGKGWVPNEVDYLLLRTPIPVQGGFVYMITFGGGKELCGRWSIDARHPK